MVSHAIPNVNTSPRWDGAADGLEHLGEPFASYGRLLLEEDAARQREQVAAFRTDLAGVVRAREEREEAQAKIVTFRQHHVTGLLMVLRWAIEDNAAALIAILDTLLELDRIRDAVIETEDRLDRLDGGTE